MNVSQFTRNLIVLGVKSFTPNNVAITGGTVSGVDISALSIKILEGLNKKMGIATLASGTITIANSSITANSRIFLTPQSGILNVGAVWVSSRVAGVSFTIMSLNILDARTVAYQIFEPA